ncbi:LysR family transcriptional regulator [Agromyces aerolatus]|uniref:LysR family transcriptional regulator n=1 Tax=Agromyces sp. LY-1074 TaxID=3074080 RepID=UPI002860E9CC|nr:MULTISPECIES: LysR family transcriptional regulator [unclassified Agromyces]MDR5700039.1 LysR family transcriptional regulator [Agromyces sp. LY-1074]MDR5706593.1 LysR family transcriptional regulator [Agromyces sp. LY-1358]
MIDLQGLRALVAVERGGSVVAAAERLGYTASAVSQQVKKLERDLGAPLLERRGRGVLLTERGRMLVADGEALLDGFERLTTMATASRAVAPLRIASFSTATRGLLAPLIGDGDGRLGVPLTITSVDPFEAMDLVADGRVDLAVVHNWNSVPLVAPSHVVTRHLCWDEADIVLPATHPLAAHETIARAALVDEAWASTPRGAICHEALLRIFADLGALPRIVAEDPDFSSLVELAAVGAAIALVPRLGRPPLPEGAVARPLADHSQVREVRVAFRHTMAESATVRTVVDALEAVGAAYGG